MDIDPDEEQLSPELLEAFEQASEYIEDRSLHRVTTKEPRWRPRRGLVWLAGVTVAVLVLAYYPTFRSPDTPAAPRLEEDLRWAVANVVRHVEASRQRYGRLPEAADLHALLSDAIIYEPAGGAYRVTGAYGSVRVVYDEGQPLEAWVAERTYGGDRER